MKFSSALLACALASAVLSSPMAAAEFHFSYRALELETPAGLEALLARVERKAHRACRAEPVLPPHYWSAKTLCANALIEDIVSEIDDSRLYNAARQKLGLVIPIPDADQLAATE